MNFAKLANLAMDCEFGNAVANLAKWFANLAMGFAKLAMRNFAMVIWQWVCEIGNGVCEIGNGFAKFAMRLRSWQWVCEMHSILRLLFHCSLHPAASYPIFNCISFSSLFL